MGDSLVTEVVLLALGVVLVIAGILSAARRFPRNSFIGIRIPSVMASDEAWKVGHAAGGPWFILAGVGGVVAAAAMLSTPSWFPGWAVIAAYSWMILCVLYSAWRAGQAVKDSAKLPDSA